MVRGVFALLVCLAVPGHVTILIVYLGQFYDSRHYLTVFSVALGVAAYAWRILLRRNRFIHTLEHEMNHVILAVLQFRRVSELSVTANAGGHVRYSRGPGGRLASDLIGLAPYYLSLPLLAVVILRLITPSWPMAARFAALGASVGVWGASLAINIRQNWRPYTYIGRPVGSTDISESGHMFSTLMITGLNVGMLAFASVTVIGGLPSLSIWLSYLMFPYEKLMLALR